MDLTPEARALNASRELAETLRDIEQVSSELKDFTRAFGRAAEAYHRELGRLEGRRLALQAQLRHQFGIDARQEECASMETPLREG
jgi:hypothetical protein